MSNDHDDIDTWLEREVTPLMPPPGSLNRIRRTARRRKTTRALTAAAGCAVVIAAAAVVPQLAGLHHHNSGQTPQAGSSPTAASVRPSSRSSTTASPSSQSSSSSPLTTAPPQHSVLSAGSSGVPVPVSFRPTSVTFAGNGTGGEVGAVIGQAGNASHPCATNYCTSLAGTSTYGTSWYGVSAPLTGAPDGSSGVSQLRFLNLSDGWAFGPALWETSGGGYPWRQESTGAMRVTDLEAARLPTGQGYAFAIFAGCSGTGQNYAADCTSFRPYTSVAGSTTWTPVVVPAPFQSKTTSAPSAATLVISGNSTVYMLTPSGEVLSGAVTGGSWKAAGMAPCKPGAAQADGQPQDAQLAAGPSLVLACDTSGKSAIYTSAAGTRWKLAGSVQTSGSATSMASATDGVIVLATTGGIYYSADMGATWHAATVTSAPAGGFTYVGMTTASDGVAVPADAQLGEVFVTSDGGQTWTSSPISAS